MRSLKAKLLNLVIFNKTSFELFVLGLDTPMRSGAMKFDTKILHLGVSFKND